MPSPQASHGHGAQVGNLRGCHVPTLSSAEIIVILTASVVVVVVGGASVRAGSSVMAVASARAVGARIAQ